ncbi:MAG: alpha/beta hydrolase [Desulfovermiculus sp.]
MIKILLFILGAYLLVVCLGYVFQDKMVFFPDPHLVGNPGDIGLDYEDVWIESAEGYSLHGWFVPGPKDNARATALFLHGNAGNISHRLEMLKIVHQLGLNCLMLDYRGYGQSQGSPSEQGLYRDAEAAWNWLVEEKGQSSRDIICWGRSLGGPVAAYVARDKSPGALIIESTFTSMPELGQKLYPFLPVKAMSRMNFPTLDYIRGLSCPVLIVHSPEDEIVPFVFGEKLYQAANEPREFLQIQGGHNEGFLVSGDKYIRGLRDFMHRFGLLSS